MKVIAFFFSPLAFSIGFLTPLFAQILLSTSTFNDSSTAWITGAVIAIGLGLVAQVRGSWVWVKP